MLGKNFSNISLCDNVPLQGKFKRSIRLYMQDERPVTDRDGYVLQNIVGKRLAEIDLIHNKYVDFKDLDLTDAKGRTSMDVNFDPTIMPEYEKIGADSTLNYECHTCVYDINGFPLSDRNGRPLASRNGKMYLIFGPRGDPTSDINGRDVIDKMGRVLTRHKILRGKDDKVMFMFDHEGKPLTDGEGFPLLDITGVKLLLFDDNNFPDSTITGSELYDAEGIAKDLQHCDFTKKPPSIKQGMKVTTDDGEAAIAFDVQGYPLTDLLGNPLCFNNGKCMVNCCTKKWVDYNGEPIFRMPRKVYDRFTLRGFTNSSGQPIRLFDDYGRPLNDLNGVPQRHASGKLLIKFDQTGAPVSDWLDRPLYDANGFTLTNKYFRPCISICNQALAERTLKTIARGVQYFECTGMPLTNSVGIPLLNAREEPMITFDNGGEPLYDYRKKIVYNGLGLPMANSLELPLLGPGDVPIRLYDKEGRPLTDSAGIPLKDVRGKCLVRIYSKGIGIMDSKGREVYDKYGYSTKFLVEFNACGGADNIDKQETIISVDGVPMLLYDEDGYPLTEQTGIVLRNRMGRSMIKCHDQGFTTTLDDKPVYDVKGRKCLKTLSKHIGLSVGLYDKNSRPLTDRSGSVLHNRKGQELVIFDKNVRPVSAMVGGELYDCKGIPLKHPFADPSRIAKNPIKQVPDGIQLYDCEDLPLTDMSGYILYTSCSIPLVFFDQNGRVKCDHSGRPVFDIRGMAVSRTSGTWRDQLNRPYRLFDSNFNPLTDEDGRELYDIEGRSLLRQDNIGRPMYTIGNILVRDAKDRRFNDIQFKPCVTPTPILRNISSLLEDDKLPLRIYDVAGNPLTDVLGRPLINSKGVLLINIKNDGLKLTDREGRQVYDKFRIPLGCSSSDRIKTMAGLPFLLFDENGIALTDDTGLPLQYEGKTMITFDKYGRPISTIDGTNLFDHANRTAQHPQFGFSIINKTCEKNNDNINELENLITVYDREGVPLKGLNGRKLN